MPQKAKLNFWNGKMLMECVKDPITVDLGTGEPKFTVVVNGVYA